MPTPQIKLAPQEHIETYDRTAEAFFREMLDMDYRTVVLTDESQLSDFSSCGLPEGIVHEHCSLNELYDAWDTWVLPRIRAHYDIELEKTSILFVDLFQKIEERLARRTH